MGRHSFGGDLAAWAFTAGGGNVATLVGGATVTLWSAATGGTQYTDLSLDAAGTTPANFITSQDGSGGTTIGTIPQFWGPADVVAMWASASGGPRALMLATDIPAQVLAHDSTLTALSSQVNAHVAARNPHGTAVADIAGVVVTGTPTDGYVLTYEASSGTWKPKVSSGGGGGGGSALLAGTQTFTGSNTFGPLANVNAQRVQIFAEATGQVADTMTFWSGTDTGAGGARQRTAYFNEKGEFRCIAAAVNSVGVRIKGQPSQTAHITEWTDTSNNPLSWVEPDGRIRAPNLGHTFAMSVSGALTAGTGKHRIYNDTGSTLTVRAVRASVGTASAGSSIICDVNKNGTTIFTTQANRPTLAAAAVTTGKLTNMDVTTLADGDYLTVDIDQIGSTTAGSDLVVQVLCY